MNEMNSISTTEVLAKANFPSFMLNPITDQESWWVSHIHLTPYNLTGIWLADHYRSWRQFFSAVHLTCHTSLGRLRLLDLLTLRGWLRPWDQWYSRLCQIMESNTGPRTNNSLSSRRAKYTMLLRFGVWKQNRDVWNSLWSRYYWGKRWNIKAAVCEFHITSHLLC